MQGISRGFVNLEVKVEVWRSGQTRGPNVGRPLTDRLNLSAARDCSLIKKLLREGLGSVSASSSGPDIEMLRLDRGSVRGAGLVLSSVLDPDVSLSTWASREI